MTQVHLYVVPEARAAERRAGGIWGRWREGGHASYPGLRSDYRHDPRVVGKLAANRHVSFEKLLGLAARGAPMNYWDIIKRDNPRKTFRLLDIDEPESTG